MANSKGRTFRLICSNCKKEFDANTSNTKYCNECDLKLNYNKCVICGKPVRKKVCCSKECLAIHRSKNNPSKRDDVRQKLKETAHKGIEAAKKTNLEKYGVEYPFQNKKVQEKVRKTQKENNNGKLAWNTEKQKQTMIKLYGADHNMKVPELVKKQKETWSKTLQRKYNCNSPMQVNEFKKKAEETNLEKYGVKSPLLLKEVQEKAVSSIKEKFLNMTKEEKMEFHNKIIKTLRKNKGVDNVYQLPEVKLKIKETFIKNYGVDHPMKSPDIRKKVFTNSRMSSLEKKTEEFLKTKNLNYEWQYIITKNNVSHAYDFAIFDDQNNLSILVECDGSYFHGYNSDANGKHVHDEIDNYNTIDLIPENVKFIKIIENDFDKGIQELSDALGIDYDNYLNDILNWCRSVGFPYPIYDNSILNISYNNLLKYEPKLNLNVRVGNKIIKHFHHSIYHCSVNNLPSTFEAWNNDELLMKCIKNRFIYKDYIDPNRVLAGFTINKIAPTPRMFSPFLAKCLIYKYLNEFDTIFDPFSGYSGRMLGAMANGKNYIGQDINKTTINESSQIIEYFDLQDKATIKEQDIITDKESEYECLFTCPPYNLKERWNNSNQLNLSCDKWIDICLNKYKCKKYLFVVDNTEKYKNNIVEELSNKSHLGNNVEKVILIENIN